MCACGWAVLIRRVVAGKSPEQAYSLTLAPKGSHVCSSVDLESTMKLYMNAGVEAVGGMEKDYDSEREGTAICWCKTGICRALK